MKQNDHKIEVVLTEDKTPWYVKIWNSYLGFVGDSSVKKLVKITAFTTFMVLMVFGCFFGYKILTDKEMADRLTEAIRKEQKAENLRDFILTPKIQKDMMALMYRIRADRVMVFELHNGKKNSSGLPFRYADMTYEEVSDEKVGNKVAMKFQNIPLTLYRFPHYLQQKKTLIMSVEEIDEIDPDFANHVRTVGGKYMAMSFLSSNGVPLGFLCASYHSKEDMPSIGTIEKYMKMYDIAISQLLDLNIQMNLDHGKNDDSDI